MQATRPFMLLCALFGAMALPPRAGAQDAARGDIDGTVATPAEERGEPLAGAAVVIEGLGRSTRTDSRGAFHFSAVPAGDVVLVARMIGRVTLRRRVSVPAAGSVHVELVLPPAAIQLSEFVVSATREQERRTSVPATIGVVTGAELRSVAPTHPSQVMDRVAGVWINQTQGEGHMAAIRQPLTTDPVYLYLEDGVPTRSTGFFNHNALYEVNIPQADRIEVTKGPGSALYGSDAVGGVIDVQTRAASATPSADVSLQGGSYGWGRLLASASNSWGGSGLRADLNVTRTDGWRAATAYTRQAGTLRWDQLLGAAQMKTVATVSHIDQSTAGLSALSLGDYENNPTLNYTPISLRNVTAVRLSTAVERRSERTLWSATAYGRYDSMELLPNWSLTYDPTDYTDENKSLGLLLKLRRDLIPDRARFIVGSDLDYSPGGRVEHQIQPVRNGPVFTSYTMGPLLYDYDVTFRGFSPYAQLELTPSPRLHLTAGARFDALGYRYATALAPVDTGRWRRPADTSVSYTHLSPKVGATYDVSPTFNLFVSYRHGFRVPSQSQLFRQGQASNTVGLTPVKVNSYEAGVRGRVGPLMDYDVTLYTMDMTDDILTFQYPDASTATVNAGRTSHRGIEAGVGIHAAPFRVDLATSYAVHRYEDWRPDSTTNLSGNEMPTAPRLIGNLEVSYAPAFLRGGLAALELKRVGTYWMDQDNTHQYDGHTLLNARLQYALSGTTVLAIRVFNVADTRHAEIAQYSAFRGEEFAPGLPRTIYASLELNPR